MTDTRITAIIAEELNAEFAALYARDPHFRAWFNNYLRNVLGVPVLHDEPPRTLAQLFEGPTKH